MANIAYMRLQRECREVATSKDIQELGIMIEIVDEQLTHLKGEIRGPPDSPYEGGRFKLDINIPSSYPFVPPTVKFTTRVWHPNVSSQTGTICLDILKDNWAASLTLRTVLLSIQALLCTPEPKDPQDAVVASQYMNKQKLFTETAKFWTQQFAHATGARNADFTAKVAKLCEMGANETDAISTLSCNEWDLRRATDYMFS
ncbi:unnamed protein product, partial [Mesorhabditis spiculigera]